MAQLRDEYKLGQANLGEIDPTSETIKLATLGMRGIAANILWTKAQTYRLKEDWTSYSAANEQIIKLQPNFPSVWQFQGWNLSYNISAEFDDYRDRYFWVMKGIRFLQEGITYNETSPRLGWYLGFVISQKIGTADEKVQFRRLFREDSDFHGGTPLEQRDNWLVGREYYLKSQAVAEKEDMLEKLNPLVFLFHAPKNRINYAMGLEEDGVFEEKAGVAWDIARRDWLDFGARDIRTTEERSIRLNDRDQVKRRIEELTAELDSMPPAGRREEIYQEKVAKLEKKEREALEMPPAQRSEEDYRWAIAAEQKVQVSYTEQAERVAADQRDEARRVAAQLAELETTLNQIERGREVINYPYWLTRCELEQRPETLEARRLVHQAEAAFRDQDMLVAQKLFEQGFAKWDEALKNFPSMRNDSLFDYDMMVSLKRYRSLLKKLDEPFPDKFPLQDILDANRDH